MMHSLNGKGLLALSVLTISFSLASCRTSRPPAIDLCQGDGYGGADCVLKDGSKIYKAPSELENYLMTTQDDMKNLVSWCYGVKPKAIESEVNKIVNQIGE